MVKLCAGVCGQESPQAHRTRLFTALQGLQVACWPHPGAMGLVEHWSGPPGELADSCGAQLVLPGQRGRSGPGRQLDSPAAGFDADGYQILCKPILQGLVEMVAL